MEEKQTKQMIPYFVHEGMVVRMERMNFRLWVTVLVLILALIASNLAWFFYEQQFESYEETTTQEVSQDTGEGGTNNFIGGDYYGETDSQDNND